MKVTYPDDIEGATPIKGFVDKKHNVWNLAPGETIDMPTESAEYMKIIFRFLVLEKEEAEEQKTGLSKAIKQKK